MRSPHHCLFFAIAATLVVSSGCHQTTGAPGNALLSPTNAATAPNLLPFGSQIRVTPPSTGSINPPNDYLNGVNTNDQVFRSQGFGSGFAQNTGVAHNTGVGSSPAARRLESSPELQNTGWIESGSDFSGVRPASATTPQTHAPSHFTPSQYTVSRDPRRDGMRAIDLTRAASPPGYVPRPSLPPSHRGINNQIGFTNSGYPNQNAGNAMVGSSIQPVTRNFTTPAPSMASQLPAAMPNNTSTVNANERLTWRRPGVQ